MLRYAPLVFKNTLRNRRRSFLTVLSIAASFCLLGVLLAMYKILFLADPTPGQAMRLITRHRVSLTLVMPASYKQKIKQVPGVKEAYISQWYGGVYKDERDPKNFFARFAVEPEDFFKVQTDMVIPDDQKLAFQRERTACIIGVKLAKKLGLQLGDRVTLKGDIFPVTLDLTVRGIYDSPDENESLYFNIEYLYQSLPPTRRDFAGTINILAASKEEVARIAERVDAEFQNAPVPTRTETEAAFLLSFASFLGNVKLFLAAISGAVTFTVLLVSANTMAMAVRERIKEVGVMKTLGYPPRGVLSILLSEAVVIAVAGAALGCLLASVLAAGVSEVGSTFLAQLKNLRVDGPIAAVCLGLGVVVGLLASIVPAASAARTSILDSLRYTG